MTEADRQLVVVIPAYNEAATIRAIAEQVLQYGLPLIVVDDGSSDETAAQLTGLPLTLLHNTHNQGKAASLWRGIGQALQQGAEAVITLDGDGQHDPVDIPRLVAAAQAYPNTLLIAARLHGREAAPTARRRANRIADFWISWAAGQWIHDSQSGFRLYPAALLRQLQPRAGQCYGFVFESEVVIEGVRRGFGCLAVPIETIYRSGARASHFRPVVDITLIVRMVAWKLLTRGMFLPGLWRALRTRRQGILEFPG